MAYETIEALIDGEIDVDGIHLECGRPDTLRAMHHIRNRFPSRRCAYYLHSDDQGFERDTVRSYLVFFARLAGTKVLPDEAVAHFGLRDQVRTKVARLTGEQRALLNFARLSLFEPEICFIECPLENLTADSRSLVLRWMGTAGETGTRFITTGQPLRDALLMPGTAWWMEDGRCLPAQTEHDEPSAGSDGAGERAGDHASGDNGPDDGLDEVRVVKVVCKSGTTTLLFDPREIDFIESLNRANYVSVRGERYLTDMTLDALEAMLNGFGFFRCHRSYIVNVQKITTMERFTRNSFNLTLSDTARSTIPLSKGRAAAMREQFGVR